ncbi:hypothetical protein CAEBREN_06743 [Caenorhabditis brenneri]|uniref:Uncharacterized protein n=1 Tax=Caenorhabditis brenneri TaxID=135651 RepID=G0P7A9_CAEBE|nr:hypothetical protein CAEBREN_06743 [Caenorhabditis brenneri]
MAKNSGKLSEWRDLTDPEVRKEQVQTMRGNTGEVYFCDSQYAFFSNYSMVSKEERELLKATYFVFADEMKKGKVVMVRKTAMANLKTFSEQYDDLPIVIRAFPYGQGRRVFTDDILELVPIVLKKQGKPMKLHYKKLQHYRNLWALKDPNLTNSVDIADFKAVMESFKVNKELIMIVPDAFHYETGMAMMEQGYGGVSLLNHNGDLVLEPLQALFCIFQAVICGRKWEKEDIMESEEDVLGHFYVEFEKVTGKYRTMKEGLLVCKEQVLTDIKSLQSHRIFTENLVGPYHKCRFAEMSYQDMVPMEWYNEEVEKFGLGVFRPKTERTEIRVCEARLILHLEWIQDYYQPEWLAKKCFLLDGLLHLIPEPLRETQRVAMTEHFQSMKEKYEQYEDEEGLMSTPSSSKASVEVRRLPHILTSDCKHEQKKEYLAIVKAEKEQKRSEEKKSQKTKDGAGSVRNAMAKLKM